MRISDWSSDGCSSDLFSSQDDASDLDLFNAVGLKVVGEHVSAIMLPDGSIFGRRVGIGGPRGMLDRVSVVGDDILIWPGRPSLTRADFDGRHRQMFGDPTTDSQIGRPQVRPPVTKAPHV